jgi:hypothetical protein
MDEENILLSQEWQVKLLIASIVDIAKNLGLVQQDVDPGMIDAPAALLLAEDCARMKIPVAPHPSSDLLGQPSFWYTVQCAALDREDWMDMCDPVRTVWQVKRSIAIHNPLLKYRIMPWEQLSPIPYSVQDTSEAAA